MGFLDIVFGRAKQVKANLDALFSIPTAAITLEAAANLKPTLSAAVVFKPASGAAFANTEEEYKEVLAELSGTTVSETSDEFGYRWVILSAGDLETLVNAVHAINRSLEDHGFGPQLLCSVFGFLDGNNSKVYWVYLYKRGTFYPFVPAGPDRRNNEQELSLKAVVGSDLPTEEDLSRWFPLWGIPI
jgi:hypothetical protein